MSKNMKSIFFMVFSVLIFLFYVNPLQAREGLSTLTFSLPGTPNDELVVATPKNWKKVEIDENQPYNFKFVHESGDRECYLAFTCYKKPVSKEIIFLDGLKPCEAIYGNKFYNNTSMIKNVYYKHEDDHAFFSFEIFKENKTEYVTIISSPYDVKENNCVVTFMIIGKKEVLDSFVDDISDFANNFAFYKS